MATVKITDLPYITSLQSNTANSVLVGVDIPGNYTGQMTLTTLARGLYSNNNLKVGNNDISFANAIGEFHGSAEPYLQVALHNDVANGSGDFVVTNDIGDDSNFYVDLGINGSNFSDPNYSAMEANDAYLYSQSSNLVIGTAASNKRINFIVGGTKTSNIVAFITTAGLYSPGVDALISANVATINGSITANAVSANSVINTNISANVATLRGEITANAASANAVINSRITSNIATANLFTQAAFDKANNALANTTGTFAGNLSITGNLSLLNGSLSSAGNMTVNGTMVLANSNFSPTEAALTITASNTVVTPSNDGYMIHISGKQNVASRIVADSYGANSYVVFAGRTARGNVTNPTAVQSGDVLLRIAGNGYGTTGYSPLGVGRIDIVAAENHTDSARGSQIKFWNMPVGSNTLTNIATFNGDSAEFTGVVKPDKGFIYTPRILTGAQTAITIDFASDSMIRATFNNTLTISFSNYTYGKVVEAWLTNTAGNGRTINLGALANNSTTGSSTLTVAAGRSAKLQYFSIDGDLPNTFVAITYA